MIGRFSLHVRRWPHFGHRDGGVTTDCPVGRRQTSTFRKLPTHAPKQNAKNAPTSAGAHITRERLYS